MQMVSTGKIRPVSSTLERFLAHDFLLVVFIFQAPRCNNKGDIGTFKFSYPRLTLKEGPSVKCDKIRRFPGHGFLLIGLPSQNSRTNNK